MSLIVLDTNVFTLFQAGNPAILRRVEARSPEDLAITIITVEEELGGWYTRLRQGRKREQLARVYQRMTDSLRFLARVQLLSFPEPAIARYEDLRANYRRLGKNDLRIAAIVLEEDAVLATCNVRDFKPIKGLQIEDWR
jgi:tRNA(fMet)-specific endonuclease VapC